MNLDNSWESLVKPGDAKDYFKLSNATPLQTATNSFKLFNAWWLAELSRLIYHNNFFDNKSIDFGSLEYELITYIENKETSTHVALLKIIQDAPCLVVVFRGTDDIDDWNINFHAYQSSFGSSGKVHSGFKKAYLSIRQELFECLRDHSLPVFITGHSLGAALATLATSELHGHDNFDSCYTFGSPRTGNPEFINSIKCDRIFRIVNNCDVVTTIPIDFALIKYKHIGLNYLIDDQGNLIESMSEDEVFTYQKSKLDGLKEYAVSKIFDPASKSIKDDLPVFLADHAPINYVLRLQKLTKS